MQRWIMHIDMDAFYASIEQLDNPELRGKALIIGGQTRGVVSTASYEARQYGVHSAMPISEARRLCPHGVYIPPRMKRYVDCSQVVRDTLRNFSPLVEMASVDEAYLDATGLERIFGPVDDLAHRVKQAVREATGGLTCSVGLAPIKFLAKICSDLHKPDGVYILSPEEMDAFLDALEVRKIPGVGKKFCAELAKIGVRFCRDVRRFPPEYWERRFGKAGVQLWQRANGEDSREVVPHSPPKSESAETTLDVDTLDRDLLRTWLLRHAERVGQSLRRQGLAGRTVTLKVKYSDFKQVTRQTSLPQPVNATETLYETAVSLLEALDPKKPVRLIGVGVSGFDGDPRPRQLSLLEAPDEKRKEQRRSQLDSTLDALRSRYGSTAVIRGRLFNDGTTEDGGRSGFEVKPKRSR